MYIISLKAASANPDDRSQGYSFVSTSEFANLDDMKYYDVDCEAHATLKSGAKDLGIQGLLTVYYSAAVVTAP